MCVVCVCVVAFLDPYDNRDIFISLNKAWELLEQFPKEELKQIEMKLREKYYARAARDKAEQERKGIKIAAHEEKKEEKKTN